MGKNCLLIPIHVDALFLDKDSSVLEAMADFSQLPYQSKVEGVKYDKNPDTAYLSESVTLPPFANQNLTLKKGVHLHIALPDALVNAPSNSSIFDQGQAFPAVPNRWLITRKLDDKKWIIESDYLHPTDKPPTLPHVAIPLPSILQNEGEEIVKASPFRYMGRALTLEEWKKDKRAINEYWANFYQHPLTAVGYGEPTFTSFFPNCHTVFGFYDDLSIRQNPGDTSKGTIDLNGKNLDYEIIGWYEKTDGYTKDPDYFHQLVQQFNQEPLLIHKQPLIAHYQRRGRLAWKDLYLKKGTTSIKAKVSPEGYGKGKLNSEVTTFLNPAGLKKLDPNSDQTILIDALWKEILEETNSITKVSGSESVITFKVKDSIKATNSQPHLTAYQEDVLVDFLNPNKHLTLLEKGNLNKIDANRTEKIWKQLTKKQWIVPLEGQEKLAAIVPAKKRKSLDVKFRKYKAKVVECLKDNPKFLTKNQLNNQLKIYFKSLSTCYLFPKQRVVDRYGVDSLFQSLLDAKLLRPYSDTHALLTSITKGNKGLKKLGLDKASKGIAALQKSDIESGRLLNPHGDFSTITKTEVENRFGNGTANWATLYKQFYIQPTLITPAGGLADIYKPLLDKDKNLSKSDFIAYFTQQAEQIWQTQIDTNYLQPSEATLNTSVIGRKMPIPKKLREEIFTISQSDVMEEFGDEYDEAIWKQLITKKWVSLLPDSKIKARINPQKIDHIPLDAKFANYTRELKAMLNTQHIIDNIVKSTNKLLYQIQKSTFTSQFGLKKGKAIWDSLLTNDWLSLVAGTTATINKNTQRKPLKGLHNPEMSAIIATLSPTIHRQTFVDYFGPTGQPIWQVLLKENLVLGTAKNNTEAIIPIAANATQGPLSVKYAYKAALQKMVQGRLKWHMGATINQATWKKETGDSELTIWKELDTIGWILPSKTSEATIEPIRNLQPLPNDLLHAQDTIDEFFYAALAQQNLPERAVFFSKINQVQETKKTNPDFQTKGEKVKLTVANSGIEAISTYLANSETAITKFPNKKEAEKASNLKGDILENIQFSRKTENLKFDLGATFKELRHEREFNGHRGGIIWTIKPLRSNDKDNPNVNDQITLPPALAHELNYLNKLQKAYEKSHQQIVSLRHQLFMDWYKYMLASYPPLDAGLYPAIDKVKYFIEQIGLTTIRRKIEITGELKIIGDPHKITNAIGHFVDIENDGLDYKKLKVTETLNHINSGLLREDSAVRAMTQSHKIAQQIRKLIQLVDLFNADQLDQPSPKHYDLGWIPGPRYWAPKEPVMLMTGDGIVQSERYGKDGRTRKDGLLEGFILSDPTIRNITRKNTKGLTAISAKIAEIEKAIAGETAPTKERIGFKTCSQQPWHPMLLEWDVAFTPYNDPSPTTINAPLGYEDKFIDDHYDLPEETPHYQLKTGKGLARGNNSNYTGYSLLTPSIVAGYQNQLVGFLDDNMIEVENGDLAGQLDVQKDISADLRKILQVACDAYTDLAKVNTKSLAQNLSGFNSGLLQHRKTIQFKVADPLGFSEYQKFTNKVRKYIGAYNLAAPAPLNDFNPLRAGKMDVNRLRIIDSFGQVMDLNSMDINKAPQLKSAFNPQEINLPPRIMQPARLNLRWMSADFEDMEMNHHPATTPICGWVVLNKLDDGLLIYDNQGVCLGVINENNIWEKPPGSEGTEVFKIANRHLQKMVVYILGKDKSFLADFISATDNALENIHPEYFTEHQDLALLMSRPIALVRASIGLEVEGLLAHSIGWDSFALDMERALKHFPIDVVNDWLRDTPKAKPVQFKTQVSLWARNLNYNMEGLQQYLQANPKVTINQIKAELPNLVERKAYQTNDVQSYEDYIRETYNFENVNFPVRLGDYRQLNDGLVGFWHSENGVDGQVDDLDKLYIPQTTLNLSEIDPNIVVGTNKTLMLDLKINEAPTILPLLMDPTGSLHATTGILPIKEITIPADQYKQILSKIQVTFLAAPLLTSKYKLDIPIPKEANYEWTWVQQVKGKWLETPTITQANFSLGWANTTGGNIWTTLKQSFYGKDFGAKKMSEIISGLFPKDTPAQQKIITQFLTNNGITSPAISPMPQQQFVHLWSQETSIQAEAKKLWDYLFIVGWLSPLEADAKVVPKQHRLNATFEAPWEGKEESVTNVLSLYKWGFAPPKIDGVFGETQRLVEGYLKLKKTVGK